jgi:hypothetical protein
MTAFHEERDDDEDIFMKCDDSTCLSWKEILSQIDDYYQVNLLLVENSTLISENNILPKSLYYRNGASGRRGRKATNMERGQKMKIICF